MKDLTKKLLVLVFAIMVFVPMIALAEDDEESKGVPVTVYIFHGDGCPHCAEALEWFSSIEDNPKFVLKTYEVWSNENNAKLMQYVGDAFNQQVDGVPFIVVGKNTESGFNDESKSKILAWIDEEFDKDIEERDDVVSEVIADKKWKEDDVVKEEKEDNPVVVGVIAVVVIIALGGIVYLARK